MPFLVAVVLGGRSTGRSDWFGWNAVAATGVAVILLAGLGTARLLADARIGWPWVASGLLFTAAGVWAGVPETGPALLVGGALTGLVATALVTGSCWGPGAGLGMAAVIGWAALSGAAGKSWATVGGALCTGVAPWFVVGSLVRSLPWGWRPGPWLLAAHIALVVLAARWVGVVPNPGWGRVAIVALAGLTVAVLTRQEA